MGSKHQLIRSLLTDAIIELCRREAFYVEELRIEGTLCIVSDRSSVLVTQITEQIGEKCIEEGDRSLPLLNYERESSTGRTDNNENGESAKKSNYVNSKESKTEDEESSCLIGELVGETKTREEEDEQKKRDHQEMMILMPREKTNGKYKCPFCPKAYGFKHNLKDHINKHTGKKPHVCKYCGMSFTFLASLCGHIKRCHFHCMPREHQCQICGNRFPNKQSLRQHFTWRHSPQKVVQKLEAKLRQRKNTSPKYNPELQHDVKVGVGSNQLFDDAKNDAQNSAKDNTVGQRSLMVKPDPESMKCHPEDSGLEEMDLSQALGLSQPDQMSNPNLAPLIEMRMSLLQASTMSFPMFPPRPAVPHYSMSPNPATKCQLSSPKLSENREPQSIPELLRSATGKFHCPYCEKAYRFKHTLKDHINTHFGKRPHVCKYCSDAFTHFASLCAHIKRRHKEHIPRDFACTICNENFMNLQSLKQHFTWRHKDIKPPHNMPMQYGSSPGRKLNSGPELPQWSSPMTTSTVTGSPRQSSSINAVPPLSQPQSSPSQMHSPQEMLFSPASPTLPSMDAFIKSGGSPFPGFAHNMFPEPVKDLMGAMNRDSHPGALFSPMGLLSPQGNILPSGSNRENYN
ncbi:hypothetical protein LSH36_243g01053 [Paralvinella palmiformis]|uniref:C2H2-type domain-containing protein n=1 Tax=Paralvinella palmiformis TaxID=53620 RepID=A0AAD9JMP7_9ANNE|nr:hypothetical protein LSH36_243g01053 [Paralvinella palmiformis]